MRLPTPRELKEAYPLSPKAAAFIASARAEAIASLSPSLAPGAPLALLIGPCSIDSPDAALDYAHRLKQLAPDLPFFTVMRLFVAKPRSYKGWKGLLYDPHLDGSSDLLHGLRLCRRLFVSLAELEVPCATELLDPLLLPYFDDLLTWGMIGARTSASQPHREMASGAPFPIGFKNDPEGNLSPALYGVAAAATPHTHFGIDPEGRIVLHSTSGNPHTHLVLRGSERGGNYDSASVAHALQQLSALSLPPRLLIDCSHGNSGKVAERQKGVFSAVMEQVRGGNGAIRGVMLESYLEGGRGEGYGVSKTDECLSWKETEELLGDVKICFYN